MSSWRVLRALVPDRVTDAIRARQSFFRRRAFHGDVVYQRMVLELIDGLGVTDFVETGTYRGDSMQFVAEERPLLRAASCEIDQRHFKRATRRLRQYSKINLVNVSSRDFIRSWVAAWEPNHLPLFFLDAHWYEDWPLEDELTAISSKRLPAAVVVDDVQVPGRIDFAFDTYGQGPRAVVCNLALVARAVDNPARYSVLLPRYTACDAFPNGDNRGLAGHAVLCQDLGSAFERLMRNPFFDSYYVRTELPEPRAVRHPLSRRPR